MQSITFEAKQTLGLFKRNVQATPDLRERSRVRHIFTLRLRILLQHSHIEVLILNTMATKIMELIVIVDG